MLASAEEAGRISAILKEDISQMGAKSWGLSSASGQVFEVADEVYVNFNNGNLSASSTDLSSFYLEISSSNFHKLTFKKAHYDADGICRAVKEIEWYVVNDVLYRKCTPVTASKCTGTFNADIECPGTEIEMAQNVSEFKFLPSKPGPGGSSNSGMQPFQPFPANPGDGFFLIDKGDGSAIALPEAKWTLRGFTRKDANAMNAGIAGNFYLADNTTACKPFSFSAGEEYAIEFYLPCNGSACTDPLDSEEKYNDMVMFQPGLDHLSVGLRNTNMGGNPISGVPDFLFYPPQSGTAGKIRNFKFSVPNNVEACVGITAAFYGPAAGGHLEIERFRVYKAIDNVYHFNNSYAISNNQEKADVKAFRLTLGINKRGEIKLDTAVIPVPNNGLVPRGESL
jgi:hypothetical protein